MRFVRPLLLSVLLAGLLGGVWVLAARDSNGGPPCLPDDVECLTGAVAKVSGVVAQAKVLEDTLAIGKEISPEVCAELGYGIGAASGTPADDLLVLLADPTAPGCTSAIVSGLLSSWSSQVTAGSDDQRSNDMLREDVGAVVRLCGDSENALCAEAVATGALLVLPADDAIAACYRLPDTTSRNCLSLLMRGILDRVDTSTGRDPREDLLALCVSWPSQVPQNDCFAAVGPSFFASAFNEIGSTSVVDPVPLAEARGFCERLGPGSLPCQDAAFRFLPTAGFVGSANSERRRAYCEAFDVSLREECLGIVSESLASTTPG